MSIIILLESYKTNMPSINFHSLSALLFVSKVIANGNIVFKMKCQYDDDDGKPSNFDGPESIRLPS